MEVLYSVLSRCPLFNHIKEADYNGLLACVNSNTRKFRSGEYVFLSGDTISHLGIIISGSVEIIKENPAGARHIMDFLGPANIFAEGVVCTAARISPVTVRVKEDSTILFIPFERISRTCSTGCSFHFQLIENMMMLLGEKNFNLNYKIEMLMLKGMREKLATYLLNESKKQNSKTFQIIPNRNELAEYLNVSRTSMCRELAKMKEQGILDYYLNSFKILSMEKLKDCLMTG